VICSLTNKECKRSDETCRYRIYRLSKRTDNSCVYLEDNRCSNYEIRPQVCRDFHCQTGWKLASVFPDSSVLGDGGSTLTLDRFLDQITDDAVFVPHPLIKVHAVFYLRPKQSIIFVKEMVGGCGKFNSRDDLYSPLLDDDKLMLLIGLFTYKETLRQLFTRFTDQAAVALSRREFLTLVWLLNKHNIVIDSRNFRGMLAGMGGIE